MRRLLGFLVLGYTALFAFYGGVGLLVAARISEVEPADKTVSLAIVAGISGICVTVVNPLAGSLSDRTRTRLGRRTPWMLGGGVTALVSIAFLAEAENLTTISIVTCVALAAANLYQAALAAIVPDQVSQLNRGRASAAIGAASVLGWGLGIQATGRLPHVLDACLILGGGLVISAVLFAVCVYDTPEQSLPARSLSLRRAHLSQFTMAFGSRDYTCVFVGRALMMSSYYLILVYLLYIMQDYIRRPGDLSAEDAVAAVVLVSGACAVVSTVVAGALADRWKRYRLPALMAGLLGGAGLLIPLASTSWKSFLAFGAVQGVAMGTYYSVDTALATLVLPDPSAPGRDLAVLNIAASAPQVIAPFLAALIVELGDYRALFPVAAGGAIASAVSIVGVRGVR